MLHSTLIYAFSIIYPFMFKIILTLMYVLSFIKERLLKNCKISDIVQKRGMGQEKGQI